MRIVVPFILGLIALAGCHSTMKSPTLKEAFKDEFMIGVAVNRMQIHQKDERGVKLITAQFNSVTPENDMKWMHIHPKRDEYNFEHADKFVQMAEANDMFIVGHALVWHSQLAPWVFKAEDGDTIRNDELLRRMKDHIQTIVGRYKGRVKGWDVVNEALAEDGSLRKSQFLDVAGKAYIEQAFRYAHEADPDAELYYNDYNLVNADKRDGAIRLIKELQSKGVRIDGIGLQAHWGLTYPSLEEIERAIEMFSDLNLNVMFTELDVSVLPNPLRMPTADISKSAQNNPALNLYTDGLPDSIQDQLAKRYGDIFRIFCKHADKITRVTFWGLHDGVSWKNNFPVRGRTDYPLLFDRLLKPKRAYDAVIETAKK